MEPIFADRSERAKIRLTGEQRAWFLHQILTQSFEDIAPGEARDAAMLTPHGRMVGFLECLATDDALLIHFERELQDVLPETIQRYVIATRVEIEDVTEQTGLVLVAGPGAREAGARLAPDAAIHPTRTVGVDAFYLWTPKTEVLALCDTLAAEGFRRADEAELEALRIGAGVPRWGKDMDEKTLAPEAGLDWAIHLDKGCYIGQEAIAKIHFRGKVNRKLRRLSASDELTAGAEVSLDGEAVGKLTSAAGTDGLAMLRYTIEPGAVVTAGDVKAEVMA